MKNLKTFGIACALVWASGSMFAQTSTVTRTSDKPLVADAGQKPSPESDDLLGFLKKYQAYIENQKALASSSAAAAPGTLGATQAKLIQAQALAQGWAAEVQNVQIVHPGANIGYQQLLATQAQLNYLDAKMNNQIAATAPATDRARPAEATLSEKERMLKKALAEKEILDKQNANSAEKPAN